MRYSYIYLLSLALLPIQNIGLSLGFMTLKVSQALFFVYFIIASLDKKTCMPKPKIASSLLGVAFLGMMTSTLFADNIERSVILAFAYFLCLVFLATLAIFLHNEKSAIRKIKFTLYASSLFYSFYGITQLLLFFLGYEANVNYEAWDIVPRVPYFSAENVHAAFLVVVIPLLYSDYLSQKTKSNHLSYLLLILINFGGLVATGSRGAILALALALILQTFFYARSKMNKGGLIRITLLGLVILVTVIALFDDLFLRFSALFGGEDGTSSVRSTHYGLMYSYFSESPFPGIGFGRSLEITGHDVHNVLLQVLFEGGVISFFPFVVALGLIFVNVFAGYRASRKFDNLRNAAIGMFVAVVGQSMVEPSLYFYHLYFTLGFATYVASMKSYTLNVKLFENNTCKYLA